MQTEGTKFYRPFISLTLAWDFLIWGANATGFHISNFVYQCLCSIGLFLLVRSICALPESNVSTLPQSRLQAIDTTADADSGSITHDTEITAAEEETVHSINFPTFVESSSLRPCAPARNGIESCLRSKDGALIALIAAALFAVHPLHPEVVSWIIARVDSVCCCFYLFSFWLYILAVRTADRSRSKAFRLLSIFLFAISLMSKEMAVTLPPAVTLLFIIYPRKNEQGAKSNALSFWTRVFSAFKESSWLWVTVILYLVIRTLALGTLTGGYQGSIGEGLSTSLMSRVFSRESFFRVLFPLNQTQFLISPGKSCARICLNIMAVVYAVSAVLLMLRLMFLKTERKVLLIILFSLIWFALVMVPAIPVWNLTDSLQGSRFIYMGTAPLCLLLAAILVPFSGQTLMDQEKRSLVREPALLHTPGGNAGLSPDLSPSSGILKVLPCATINAAAGFSIAIVAVFSFVAFINNTAWAHAGTELKKLRQQIEIAVSGLSSSQSLVLLNLPHTHNGAHMLYNAATLSVLLEPPLTRRNLIKRVVTFEPVLFGDDDLLRIERLKAMIVQPERFAIARWDRRAMRINALNLSLDEKSVELAGGAQVPQPDKLLASPVTDVSSCGTDFLDIELTASPSPGVTEVPVAIQWSSPSSPFPSSERSFVKPVPADGKPQRIRIHVSERKSWVMSERIHRLYIWCPVKGHRIQISRVSCLGGANMIPAISAGSRGFVEDEGGVVRTSSAVGTFSYDVSKIPGAVGAIYEVSQPDAWFEHYSGTYRDDKPCDKVSARGRFNAKSMAEAEFDISSLPGSGFYELRVAAVDRDNKIVGYFSDPIMFQARVAAGGAKKMKNKAKQSPDAKS